MNPIARDLDQRRGALPAFESSVELARRGEFGIPTVGSLQNLNPCVNCGACCAHFRVQFYWREANPEDSPHPVPQNLVEDLTPTFRCMKGTADKHHPQCAALKGRIGKDGKCSIYELRPTPCRAFEASFENGRRNSRCDEARRAHGLKPLRPQDWPA